MELGNYLLFNKKEEELVKKVEELDKYHWSKGYGYNKLLLNP